MTPVPFFLDVICSEENESTGIKKRLQKISEKIRVVISLFCLDEDLYSWCCTLVHRVTSLCRTVHAVCPAPNTPPRVLILLFAKPVCVNVLRRLGHQALILASRVMIEHSV